ncbi:hypothetical protein JCM10213_008164 [Rhodosporidiobolus nylandii]
MSTIEAHHDVEKAVDHPLEAKPETTLQEDVAAYGLEKVMERHGRIDLVPLPSDDPQDPLNWASWKKHAVLFQVAFAAMMGPFSAAATIPSFEDFVVDFGVSITQASYTVSIVIIFLGVMPLLFAPISHRIGRRPILLLSFGISAAFHLGAGYVNSYGSLMALRAMHGIFLSPAQSIGANMVSEMFFLHEKGAKTGIWTLLTSLGPPVAPFIFGFVVFHTNTWRWTFYVLAIVNLVQFILAVFLLPETMYSRPTRGAPGSAAPLAEPVEQRTAWWKPYLAFNRRSTAPWKSVPFECIKPLSLFARPEVFLPTLAYAVLFSYSNVLLTIEIPALLGRKARLNAQQTGLQFIGAIVGAVVGEIIAGRGSDLWMLYRTQKANGDRQPEYRLPFALPGFVLGFIGILVFGIQLGKLTPGHWNVTPVIGVALSVAGLQLVTTTTYAYCIESQPPHLVDRVSPFIAFVRQLYAFISPFYLTLAFENLGDKEAGALYASLSLGVGLITTILCLIKGRDWRRSNTLA